MFLAITSTQAAIDLTPAIKEYTREGFVYRQVTFKADTGSVTFVPPQTWTIDGGKDRSRLSVPSKPLVEATIMARPLTVAHPFDEPTVKALEQQVLREVPVGSQATELVKTEENPVMMGSNLSLGFVLTYKTLGQTFSRSVVFVNTPDTQLIFRLSAPKAGFDELNGVFRRSITSWQWVEAKQTPDADSSAPVR